MKEIKGGVTAALGFKASGVAAGLKKNGVLDVAMITSDTPAVAALMTTSNAVKAAPVLWDNAIVRTKGKAIRAIQDSSNEGVKRMDMAVGKVNLAAELAASSGDALTEILNLSEQTADQVRSIATASEEQSASSEEIARSVEHVNTIAAETSQAMGEANKAVSELAAQAQNLSRIIDNLKNS